MLQRSRKITMWLMLWLVPLAGLTQPGQQSFKITNRLSQTQFPLSTNYTMIKDSLGFLWLTSPDGLLKFDGSSFTAFRSTDKRRTIIGRETLGLVEDSLHNIWIGSDSGLNRYDIRADSFQTFPLIRQNISGINYFIPFYAAKDEVWYIDRNIGISAINIKSGKRRILFGNVPPVFYYYRLTYTFYDSASQSIWFPSEEAILRFSLKDGLSYTSLPGDKENLLIKPKRLLALVNDTARHCVWFAESGLYKINFLEKKIQSCGELSDSSLRVNALELDKYNRLWVGTRTQGIFIYDPEKNSFQHILHEPGSPGLQSNSVRNIYCDKNGMVWAGTGVGLDQLTDNTAIQHYASYTGTGNDLTSGYVTSFAEGRKGQIWVATLDGGLNIFDPTQGIFEHLMKKDIPGLPSDRVRMIYIDTISNKAWVSVDFGPGELDIDTKRYKQIIFKSVDRKAIDPLTIWSQNWATLNDSLWIMGTWTGVYMYKKGNDTAFQLPFLSDKNIQYIGKGNNIFFFTSLDLFPEAYSYINGKWGYLGKLFGSMPVLCIAWDDISQSWWIGSTKGLYHMDKSFKIMRHYTMDDGLPDNTISAIVADKKGLFWLGTSGGLCVFDTKREYFNNIGDAYGFRNRYHRQVCLLASNGDIYLSAGNGFDRVQPDLVNYHFPSAKIYFKSLSIDKKNLGNSININQTPEISLKYFQNSINIETGVMDFYSSGKNQIRYKLKGLHNDWQNADVNYHIHYGSLAPGTYEFIMEAANANNEWNGPEKRIKFVIAPPFWATWWFRILLFIFVSILFAAIYMYRVHQLKKIISLRTNISRDLHDEIGSTLSGISIIGKMAKQNLQSNRTTDAENLLDKIIGSSTEMLSKMSDIVWAINPTNDSFQQIVSRLRNYTQATATPMGVILNFKVEKDLEQYNLDMQRRKNIYLICKEAINNSLKYSLCKNLSVIFTHENHQFHISVRDDGKGFDSERQVEGNGLRNMQARAKEINATLIIKTAKDEGTLVKLYV